MLHPMRSICPILEPALKYLGRGWGHWHLPVSVKMRCECCNCINILWMLCPGFNSWRKERIKENIGMSLDRCNVICIPKIIRIKREVRVDQIDMMVQYHIKFQIISQTCLCWRVSHPRSAKTLPVLLSFVAPVTILADTVWIQSQILFYIN